MLSVVPGDINLDGVVSGGDYTIWAENFGATGADWSEGDVSGDAHVDGADYTIWAEHFGQSVSQDLQLSVPAPDGQADRFHVVRQNDRLEIWLNGELALRPTVGLVETLTIHGADDDDTLSIDLSAGDLGLVGGIAFAGGGGQDTFQVRGTSGDDWLALGPATLAIGGFASSWSSVESLDLQGGDGGDVLAVDGEPSESIHFDGGAGFDSLQLAGGQFANVDYEASGPNSGTIRRDGREIAYDGIEPIDDTTVAATLTITGTAGGEAIEIVDGPLVLGFQTTRVQSVTASFELVNFANKTDVTVDGGGGADSFLLDAALVTPGLASLTIVGDAAGDSFNIERTRAATATVIDAAGGDDTISVEGAALLGPLSVGGGAQSSSDTLIINGTAAADAVTVTATDVTVAGSSPTVYAGIESVVINTLAGNDTIDVLAIGAATAANGGADDDVFNVSSPLTFALGVDGGPHASGDTLNILGTAGNDAFELAGSTVTVNAGAAVTYAAIEDLNLDANGGAADALNVQGTAGADAFTLTSTRVGVAGSPAADYANFETLTLLGLAGNDTFDLQSTAAGVTYSAQGGANDDTFTVQGAALLGALNIDGGPQSSADTVNILGTAGNDAFELAGSTVTVNAGSAVAYAAIEDLNLDANGGAADALNVQGTAGADAFTLTSTRVGVAGSPAADYANFETVTLLGLVGNDTFDLQSTASGVTYFAQGGANDDTFTVQGAALAGALNVDGGPQTVEDRLTIEATAGADTIAVSSTSVTVNAAAPTNYTEVSPVVVRGLAGDDTVNVASTGAETTIETGDDDDTINVAAPLSFALVVNGGAQSGGSDTLTVNGTAANDAFTLDGATVTVAPGAAISFAQIEDLNLDANGGGGDNLMVLGSAAADAFTLTATRVTRAGFLPADYSDFETLDLLGLAGADTFDIQSTATGVVSSAVGGADDDDVTVAGNQLAGLLNVDGGSQTVEDTLTVNGTASGDSIAISSSAVAVNAASPTNYAAIEQLFVNGLAGTDVFSVASTAAGVVTTITGGNEDDQVFVDGPNLNGPLVVSGQLNSNTVEVTGSGGADTFVLSATTITLNGQPPITYDTTSIVRLLGIGGNDTFTVDATPASSTVFLDGAAGLDQFNLRGSGTGGTLNVLGGADNDTIRVASLAPATSGGVLDGNLDDIGGNVSVEAGGGANQLFVSDRTSPTANPSVLVTGNQITGLAGPTNSAIVGYTAAGGSYSLLQVAGSDLAADTFDLRGASASSNEFFLLGGADTALMRSTLAGTSTLVHSGDGDDLVRVASFSPPITANGINGALSVVGGAQGAIDRLVIDDSGETAATDATLNAAAVSGMSPQPVQYSDIEAVDLLFGSASDELLIDYNGGALPDITAAMSGGNDDVTIQSPPVGALVGPQIGHAPNCLTQAVDFGSFAQIDGGAGDDDRIIVLGRDGVDDRLSVGAFGSLDSLQQNNVEIIRLFGWSGNDLLNNFTGGCGFFEGGDGDDRLFGGSMTDVMFGGAGVDFLCGMDGNDYLLPDHASDRSIHVEGGEFADGGFGTDKAFMIGTGNPDQLNNSELISGFSFELDILTWLYGVLVNGDSILEEALNQSCSRP